jgi:hypothetical protein
MFGLLVPLSGFVKKRDINCKTDLDLPFIDTSEFHKAASSLRNSCLRPVSQLHITDRERSGVISGTTLKVIEP